MTVLLTLTTAGPDTGLFSLYSNLDGYVVPFETNVSKTALQAGYLTNLCPDYTTTVRVKSTGKCSTHVDIVLTTIPPVACSGTAISGGLGIAERIINLDPAGGVIVIGADGQSVPDKFEIIHNGVKKATSGMTVANAGPFDNVYGTPPSNTVPVPPAQNTVDQFIGTGSSISGGVVPTRNAAFASANPSLSYIVASPQQQLVWWNYTPLDYSVAQTVTVRITGPSGTSWSFARKCSTTSTTSSSTSSTTSSTSTTTTTTTAPLITFLMTNGYSTQSAPCSDVSFPINVKCADNPMILGSQVYQNVVGFPPFAGGGFWRKVGVGNYTVQINGPGIVTGKFACP